MNLPKHDFIIIQGPEISLSENFLSKIEESGKKVKIIGDGKKELSFQEIVEGLKTKSKDAIIVVCAHGFARFGNHYLDLLISLMKTKDLLQYLKQSNVKNCILHSCSSGAAHKNDTKDFNGALITTATTNGVALNIIDEFSFQNILKDKEPNTFISSFLHSYITTPTTSISFTKDNGKKFHYVARSPRKALIRDEEVIRYKGMQLAEFLSKLIKETGKDSKYVKEAKNAIEQNSDFAYLLSTVERLPQKVKKLNINLIKANGFSNDELAKTIKSFWLTDALFKKNKAKVVKTYAKKLPELCTDEVSPFETCLKNPDKTKKALKILFNLGFVNKPINNSGETPLIWALKNNRTIVNKLIKAGADVNLKNNDGQTPLSYAVSLGNQHLCDMLIKAGAKKDLMREEEHRISFLESKENHPKITPSPDSKVLVSGTDKLMSFVGKVKSKLGGSKNKRSDNSALPCKPGSPEKSRNQ